MPGKIRVTVWNEFRDEKRWPEILELYPGGIHAALGRMLEGCDDMEVTLSTFWDEDQGLGEERLQQTDVLIYYSHMLQREVDAARVERVIQRVHEGMGLILLHSALGSDLCKRLLGFYWKVPYREARETERVFVIEPSHPIADGLGQYFEFPESEMYADAAQIPTPDEVVFLSWYAGGNAERSGFTYRRGAGKIFCFTPGHAWYSVLNQPGYGMVLRNAVRWIRPPRNPYLPVEGPIGPIVSKEEEGFV
ncbi:MAG TPA: ThuA domain-containing protein [Clostridia bacterium]|nr:ThuA domain-containing protein [Clostridia bacterium]